MTKRTLHLTLIAGEPSGDQWGAGVMRALKKIVAEERPDLLLIFSGVGGEKMQQEGLQSWFPMEELTLMGFFEIVPHIPRLLRRIRETANHIEALAPALVLTIDAPDFNLRVIRRIQHLKVKKVHFVAPSVWAYRPERAETFAKLYDILFALLPFEPPYFTKHGLACEYIGHPLLEQALPESSLSAFRARHRLQSDDIIILCMPGSRRGEIKRMLPIFCETLHLLQQKWPKLKPIFITLPTHEEKMRAAIPSALNALVLAKEGNEAAFHAATLALVKSGTGALELARYSLPMIVTYHVNPLTAWIAKKILTTPYVNLINLILGRPAIPELLQEKGRPENLALALNSLLQNKSAQEAQREAMHKALQLLGQGQTPSPSEKAARHLLALLS